jgi:hypothetical protein
MTKRSVIPFPIKKLFVDLHLKNGGKYHNMSLTQADVNALITSVSNNPDSEIVFIEVR